jgi:PBSX family phage portal protein
MSASKSLGGAASETIADAVERSERKANRLVKAYVVGDDPRDATKADEAAAGGAGSRALSEKELFGPVIDRIVPPPYDPFVLSRLVEQSSELGQCIDAMVSNIEGFGYLIVPRVRVDAEGLAVDRVKEIKAEKSRIFNLLQRIGQGEAFTSLRRRTRRELESAGNGYWEVIRNLRGEIIGLNLIPSYQMRLGLQNDTLVRVKIAYLVVDEEGRYGIEKVLTLKRFRQYVQGVMSVVTSSGATSRSCSQRWFKEYGDPRVIDNRNGAVVGMPDKEAVTNFEGSGSPMPEEYRASEILHTRIYSSRSPYGVPRWIGNIVAVLGVRRAEEVNYTTLANNNIPSMVVTVSNGQLTPDTIERIEQFVSTQVRGQANYSSFLLLEGESSLEGEDAGQVKIDIKPLTREQHTDALFVTYIKSEKDGIRRSFRLPELFVGVAGSINRATAEAARCLTDEQVFAPERDESDHTVNRILIDEGIVHHAFKSRTPNITDNESLVAMLAAAERTGGVTPEIARAVVEDVFPQAAEAMPLSPKIDPHVPFSLTMAEAIKNQAIPTEVNQQIAPVQPSGNVGKAFEEAVVKDPLGVGDRPRDEIRLIMRANEELYTDDHGSAAEG